DGTIDIEVHAERYEVIVVDARQAAPDQGAIGAVTGHALDRIDTQRADTHIEIAGAIEHIVDEIVVVAHHRSDARNQFDIGASGFTAMPPYRITRGPLEHADDIAADHRCT